jgi:hypothetical protein
MRKSLVVLTTIVSAALLVGVPLSAQAAPQGSPVPAPVPPVKLYDLTNPTRTRVQGPNNDALNRFLQSTEGTAVTMDAATGKIIALSAGSGPTSARLIDGTFVYGIPSATTTDNLRNYIATHTTSIVVNSATGALVSVIAKK